MMARRPNQAQSRLIFAFDHSANRIANGSGRQQRCFQRAGADNRIGLDLPPAATDELDHFVDIGSIVNAGDFSRQRRLPDRPLASSGEPASIEQPNDVFEARGVFRVAAGAMAEESRIGVKQGHTPVCRNTWRRGRQ